MKTKRQKPGLFQTNANEHPMTPKVAKIVASWTWKKGAGHTVREAVDISLKAYEEWLRKLKLVKIGSNKITNRIHRFRLHLLSVLPSPATLVERWMRDVFQNYSFRRDFSGDLNLYRWMPDDGKSGNRFSAMGMEIAEEWGNDSQLWNQLMSEMED